MNPNEDQKKGRSDVNIPFPFSIIVKKNDTFLKVRRKVEKGSRVWVVH